jgi:TRAP-type transport system periplasmic protein
MFHVFSRAAAAAVLLWPALAAADPINLKLSFFTSDRSLIYQTSVKPFVDAVNAQGNGLIHIEVYFSGAISPVQSRQPQLVSDGKADLAVIVPAQSPERFYDCPALALPGLFPNTQIASRIYGDLANSGMLAGYEDFYIVGTFVSAPEAVNSRREIASMADLKGLRIRVNNMMEANTLQQFGAVPVVLPLNQTSDAVSAGTIDAATAPPSMLSEFGLGRVTTYHYMMGLGAVPTVLLMNRKKFESLPPQAQSIIRKYSGQWLSDYSAKQFDLSDRAALEALKADSRRHVIFPSGADASSIHAVYGRVIEDYAGSSDHDRDLLTRIRAELAKPSTD